MLHVFYAFEMFSNNQNLWYLWYGLSTSGPKAAGNYLHANSKSCRAGMSLRDPVPQWVDYGWFPAGTIHINNACTHCSERQV